MHRLHKIFKYAKEQNVRVMVDAEQSYFQPAIHRYIKHIFVKMNISTESPWQAGHGDDEDLQYREGDCVQHLPMLPQEGSQDHHPGSWTGQPPCLNIALNSVLTIEKSFLQAKRQNFYFGAKLVRGAYMEQVLFPISP